MNNIAVLIICGVVLFTTLTFLYKELSIHIHTKRIRKFAKEFSKSYKETCEDFCDSIDDIVIFIEEWLESDRSDEFLYKLEDIAEKIVYQDNSEKVEKPEE